MTFALAMVFALLLDVLVGWPAWIYARIGHPVTWLGRVIAWADGRFNRKDLSGDARRRAGAVLGLTVVAGVFLLGWTIEVMLPSGWIGSVLLGIFAWPLVAARSLHNHVDAVAKPLKVDDLETARRAVSMIVGRDPTTLDAPAMARAGLESLAENASDGVIAPLFWGAIFGLPGIAAYKAINTMDSMIGYKTPRHLAFGWAAARIDDVVNFVPARLTGVLIVAVSKARGPAFRAMIQDAREHRSPNAGWPEAAMAGALGIRLSGPRMYAEGKSDDPFLNASGVDPNADDMARGLRIFRHTVLLTAGLLVLAAVV